MQQLPQVKFTGPSPSLCSLPSAPLPSPVLPSLCLCLCLCSMTREILLGSASFIRKQILAEMGYSCASSCVLTADLDERAMGSRASDREAPALVALLAKAKADEIIRKICLQYPDEDDRRAHLPGLLLTADSVATFQGQILEKPDSLVQAASFLEGYGSGSPMSIVSGICVTNLWSGAQFQGVDTSTAYFRPFSQEAIAALLEEGTVLRCAGGVMIEHSLMQPFVQEIVGSIDGIQGLPKHLAEQLIRDAANA